MKELSFIQRLKKELPLWVKKGWVLEQNQQPILDSVLEYNEAPTGPIPFAFAWMGVLLLGAGIITFFAANWSGLTKIIKLSVLLGSLWGSYLIAGLYLIKGRNSPFSYKMGQVLLLLGAIIFGANIWLIAQIYHIDAHYPNCVLLWTLGTLLTSYLLRSEATLIMSIVLATLWTAMEMFDVLRTVHWAFLPVWALFLYPIVKEQWKISLRIAMLSLFIWSIFVIVLYVGDVFFVQIYFLISLSIFLLGQVLSTYQNTKLFSKTVQHFSSFFALLSLFALTFPSNITKERGLFFDIVPTFGFSQTLIALSLVVITMIWIAKRSKPSFNTTSFIWGQGLLFLVILLIFFNIRLGSLVENHKGMIALAFNFVFFVGIAWLIYIGYRTRDRFFINLGFIYFSVGVLCRYFDTFWTYQNRSLFFIVGGLILTLGSFYFEKQRRKLIRHIEDNNNLGDSP